MKKFLENNKIYTETISQILLGVMALLVSVTSCKIDERSLKVAEADLKTTFHIKEIGFLVNNKLHEKELFIYHLGDRPNNVTIEKSSMVEVTVNKYMNNEYSKFFRTNFYSISRPYDNNNDGLIEKYFRRNNYYDFYEAYKTLQSSVNSDTVISAKLQNIIKVNYTNKLGEDNTVFFLNDELISNYKYLELSKIYNKTPYFTFEVNYIKDIIKEISKG